MAKEYEANLVSVIIPSYNSARYLPEAIESVLKQSYRKTEIILVDDGSTDNTQEIIALFGNKINYFYKENGGPASARNFGINRSRGEFIAFLDADDIWLPDKIKIQIEYFKKHPNYFLVHSNTLIFEAGKELYPRFIHNKPISGNIYQKLFLNNCINNLTVILRRECFYEVGGFDENEALIGLEDYDLWLRIGSQYEIGYFDEIVSIYRIHQNNITKESKAIRSLLFLMDKFENSDSTNLKLPVRIFTQKKQQIYFRWACHLIEEKKFSKAFGLFLSAANGKGLKLSSIICAFFCLLNTNALAKSYAASLSLKSYADYLLYEKKFCDAKKFYIKSIKAFAVQKIAYKKLFYLYLRRFHCKFFA